MIWLIIFFGAALIFGHKLGQAIKQINKVLGNSGIDTKTQKELLKKFK